MSSKAKVKVSFAESKEKKGDLVISKIKK